MKTVITIQKKVLTIGMVFVLLLSVLWVSACASRGAEEYEDEEFSEEGSTIESSAPVADATGSPSDVSAPSTATAGATGVASDAPAPVVTASAGTPDRTVRKEEIVIAPLTPALFRLLGDDYKFVSVYISHPVRLERELFETDADVAVRPDGSIILVDKKISDIVEIPVVDRGAVSKMENVTVARVDWHVLGIEFENLPDIVGFAANMSVPESRYYLQFDNDERGILRYTDKDYLVRYETKERPYLMVKVSSRLIEETSRRIANREWVSPMGSTSAGGR
jgi:hypothetical protein